MVVADGLGQPLDQIIDWAQISLTIPERLMDGHDAAVVMEPLWRAAGRGPDARATTEDSAQWAPTNGGVSSRELRRRSAIALAVFDTYFRSPSRRTRGMLGSLGVALKQGREREARRAAKAKNSTGRLLRA